MRKLNEIDIAILTCKFNPPHEGDSFTEQEVCDKLNYIKAAIIKKELNDLHKGQYITAVLNTSVNKKKCTDKIYEIAERGEEVFNK